MPSVFVGEARQPATVIGVRKHGERYLLELKGCTSLEAAEAWRSAEVRVAVENAPALPAGTYFHWQILGLTVITDEGVVLGQVAEILPTGANDVYLVRGEREILLPATQEVVLQIDPAAGQMIVHLLPGLVRVHPSQAPDPPLAPNAPGPCRTHIARHVFPARRREAVPQSGRKGP